MRGVLIGRFQPFHKGHLKIIKKILGEVDELIIVIGSSQYKDTRENPLSAEEREEMINRALKEKQITSFQVHKVPDIGDDNLYPGHVMSRVPHFDVLFSGNELVQRLFKSAGKKVRNIKHIRRTAYEGREVRKRILGGRRWRHLVPTSVREYLDEVDFPGRVKHLA
jgi:nicotinamide-nucleotide adenylyltransferase